MMQFFKQLGKWRIFLIIFQLTAGWNPAAAHEGEPHGEPPPTAVSNIGGPVMLSGEAKKNLGLQLEDTDLRTIYSLIKCYGMVDPIPTKVHWVTVRISGRVLQVFVNLGDSVEKGTLLAKVESRQIGEPPPQIEIQSPVKGIITEHHVFAGEPVEPDKVLFRIMDLSTVYVKCHIYEADIAKVKQGQRARIYVESFPDKFFEGEVDILGGQLEEETRTLPVWLKVENPRRELLPNMRAESNLITGEAADAITVPVEAVLGDAGNYFVFLEKGEYIEKGTYFVRQPVVVGMRDDRYVEIKEGLLPGDRVVVKGNYQLQFMPAYSPEKDEDDVKAKGKK